MTHRHLILLVSLTLLAGCSRKPAQEKVEAASKADDPLVVRVGTAETQVVDQAISVTGSLHPDEMVSMSSEVAGRVAAIYFDFGQHVRKGEVIAELDKREFQLQVERSRAALTQALARIGLDPGQEEVVPKSTPAIRQARAQMDDARSKYESATRLVETGDISRERYIELEKAFRAREAAVEAAQDELRTQLANIQALQAEVKLAEKRLNDATVRAPFDGAITAKLVSPGQYLKENTAIVTLVKTNPLRLQVDIPESAAGTVRVGTSLAFATAAIPGAEFHAAVRELNPALDAKSRSLTVEARLSESDPRLKPGMFVQVRLVIAHNAKIVVVPKQALFAVAGLTKIFKIRDGRAVELKISPGMQREGWVEVPGEQIRAGDSVAVSNLAALVNGVAVKVERPNGGNS